jgi:hypothetical protein
MIKKLVIVFQLLEWQHLYIHESCLCQYLLPPVCLPHVSMLLSVCLLHVVCKPVDDISLLVTLNPLGFLSKENFLNLYSSLLAVPLSYKAFDNVSPI